MDRKHLATLQRMFAEIESSGRFARPGALLRLSDGTFVDLRVKPSTFVDSKRFGAFLQLVSEQMEFGRRATRSRIFDEQMCAAEIEELRRFGHRFVVSGE